jgi:hypothetical protein
VIENKQPIADDGLACRRQPLISINEFGDTNLLSCSNFIERVPERLTLVLRPWILIVLFTTGHFVGRQRESERFCGLEIDDQLKLGGLYDRHVGAAKNFFMKPKAAAAAHGQRLATTPQRRRLANTFVARKGQSGAT